MKILFIHQNFPGQYRALAPIVRGLGHDVRALSQRKMSEYSGIQNFVYDIRRSSTKNIHPWLTNTETAVIRGEAVAQALMQFVQSGWVPDLIIGHTGWGELMFVKQVLPSTPVIAYCEYYYLAEGADMGFDPEFPTRRNDFSFSTQVRNLHLLSSGLNADVGISPTHWQASLFPDVVKSRIQVIHDGINTQQLKPNSEASVQLGDGLVLRKGDEVVTFINRNLEPMRGYHQFMRALPEILNRRPNAHVVIVGGDEVSYGQKLNPDQPSHKQVFLDEVKAQLDASRVHFVGKVPYSVLIDLLQVSAAHVYLTYPFVLSWSMLEVMSLGALVIGSATAPVQEVIKHGQNGLLVDFFSPQQIADTVCAVLSRPKDYEHLRVAARQTVVTQYDFSTVCLPRHLELINRYLKG